jgi:hypothetical protein
MLAIQRLNLSKKPVDISDQFLVVIVSIIYVFLKILEVLSEVLACV